MTGIPHPYTMTMLKELWRAEMLAEAERDRLVRLADSGRTRRFPAVPIVLAAVIAALLLGAAIATGNEPESASAVLTGVNARPASHVRVVDEHVLDPSATQPFTANRL